MKPLTFISLCTILILSGCASLENSPQRSDNVNTELHALKPYFSANVIKDYNDKKGAAKQEYRDNVVFGRIRAIDLNYTKFVNDITMESKGLSIGTDSAVLLLSAGGALSKVSSTQAIFSQATGALTGIKTSFDKNAYYDQTLFAVISQMQASRAEILATIYNGLGGNVIQYSLLKALIDVEDYYQAGTISHAIMEITKTTGSKKTAADIELKNSAYIKLAVPEKK
ncbi:MAG: hypothetical protein HGB00_08365 [Chlorobiaceae bacterium]|nr:hypothetical protein [Chlorobiaceae bacterium]